MAGPPGTQPPRRWRPRLHWELLLCGVRGHRIVGTDAAAIRPADERPRALLTYLASLEQTRAMELSLVLPGHGQPIVDHAALIDERFRLHRRRAEKIRALIATRAATAHEIAHELWGNVAVTQAYLTLSEVLGHLDMLLAEGRAVERESGGVVRFEAA